MEKEVCASCMPLFQELRNEIDELKRRLLAYENAHTPPSRLRWQPKKPAVEQKKRGAPEGQ